MKTSAIVVLALAGLSVGTYLWKGHEDQRKAERAERAAERRAELQRRAQAESVSVKAFETPHGTLLRLSVPMPTRHSLQESTHCFVWQPTQGASSMACNAQPDFVGIAE